MTSPPATLTSTGLLKRTRTSSIAAVSNGSATSAKTCVSSSDTTMMRWLLANAMGTRVASAVWMRSGSILFT